MATIKSKLEFDHESAKLCGRMVSMDGETRLRASVAAAEMVDGLPAFLRNSPHCRGEIETLNMLIAGVEAEHKTAA